MRLLARADLRTSCAGDGVLKLGVPLSVATLFAPAPWSGFSHTLVDGYLELNILTLGPSLGPKDVQLRSPHRTNEGSGFYANFHHDLDPDAVKT